MTFTGLKILRPLNILISAIAVVVGLNLSKVSILSKNGLLSILIIGLLTAFANVLNDYFDRELDQIAHPSRPLVKRDLSENAAIIISGLMAFLALIASYFLNLAALIYTVFLVVLIYLYNRKLKGVPLLGNLTVSFVATSVFLFIGTFTLDLKPLIFPSLFAFVFHLGREIIKDLEDMKADGIFGFKTLPQVLGETKTLVFARFSILLLIAVSISPVIFKLYGWPYILIVFFGMDVPLLYNFYVLVINTGEKNRIDYGKLSTILKLTVFPALLGLFFGG